MLFTAGITAPLVRDPKVTLTTIGASACLFCQWDLYCQRYLVGRKKP